MNKYQWNYSTDAKYAMTLEEYVLKLCDEICEPLEHLEECDGDMMMSEYRKLVGGAWHLRHLVKQLNEEEL
tara:strand:+ start:83 stop:295 length:213 start_codon:yes stop_codon:yes gene_type:complete